MTTDEHLQRLTGIVESLAGTVVAHDNQIEALIRIAEKHDREMVEIRENARKAEAEARERGRVLDERIANLVSAIGELIRRRNGKS